MSTFRRNFLFSALKPLLRDSTQCLEVDGILDLRAGGPPRPGTISSGLYRKGKTSAVGAMERKATTHVGSWLSLSCVPSPAKQVGTSRFRAEAMGNENSAPPAAGAWPDLQHKKRNATAELGRDRPGTETLGPLLKRKIKTAADQAASMLMPPPSSKCLYKHKATRQLGGDLLMNMAETAAPLLKWMQNEANEAAVRTMVPTPSSENLYKHEAMGQLGGDLLMNLDETSVPLLKWIKNDPDEAAVKTMVLPPSSENLLKHKATGQLGGTLFSKQTETAKPSLVKRIATAADEASAEAATKLLSAPPSGCLYKLKSKDQPGRNHPRREDLTKSYSRLCGAENTREKRALRRAGIRRGNSLPEGEIDAIAIVIELDIISIIIIIISTIYTAITTAAPRHRCISMNEVRKKLFTISLSGKAAHWYKLLKNGDSIDWEDIVPLFYSKFYPPSEIHKDRNRIYNFWPHDGESIAQAWGRLKSLMLKCPIHELPGNVIIDNFYARLSFQDKTLLDTSCSGSFTRNKEEFKRDLLDRIQENTEGWENDKDRESGIIYDYKCIEAFMDTDKFRNMSATYGLDSQVVANLYKAFASHYELPKKNFDKYHEPYKDKVDSSVNKCVVIETVDNVIPEAYIEKTPFPAKMKEYSVISSAVNKSEKKPKEPEEQIKIEPAVAIVKDLVTENVEDGHIIFCEDASNIVSHPNKPKQVSVPMLSVRIGDHCYYGLCDIGASVSAIPYELYTEIMHEIGSCELEDIDVVIHLANRETISPIGIVRDVEVLCGKIKYPADFLVLGSAASDHCPIIFGRPFLNTCGAIIDCKKEKILTRFAGEPYEFNFSKFTKTPYKADLPSNDFKMEQCASIVLVPNNPLQQHLENSESEAFRKERDELEEIFLRQPILKHDLPVEDLGTTPPPKEDPVFDLKPLPDNLKYAHIDDKKIYPVIISSKLSEIEEERLLEILKKHRGAIGYTLDDLKGISPSICQHAINMEEDAKPVVEHQRRLIPKMKEVVRNEVLKLLEAGIIYPIADSRWVSPVHCVPKKGGMTVVPNDNDELIPQRIVVGYRMCIDFRKVNKVTKKDHYPLPFIDQMLERCMSAIFHGFCESIVEVFMDDFSVYGNSFDNCLRNLDKVLQRCEETNLVLNWEKCHFMVNEGIVLGHKISERGIEVDRAKVEAIEKMPYPRDVKDRKGADNPVADNLSRLENIAYDHVPVNDSFPNEQLAVIKGALPPALDLDSFPCVEEAIRVADEFCDQYRALRREVEILQEENQRLRRMLEYYSNPSTRPSPPHSGNNESLQVLVQNYKIEKLKLKEILMKREKKPSPSSPKE
ncbi:hypothetical protein QYE76_059583 [Lolium multiflorum]|uniref:DNA-directed DNA polymerase n=1 Tax=Lolium multiflorum TaxID=4521 RepID=A0AAD8W3G1_LOLMU|nr:hypothetical protein QYE76_059583 [Lolium multiflorum]